MSLSSELHFRTQSPQSVNLWRPRTQGAQGALKQKSPSTPKPLQPLSPKIFVELPGRKSRRPPEMRPKKPTSWPETPSARMQRGRLKRPSVVSASAHSTDAKLRVFLFLDIWSMFSSGVHASRSKVRRGVVSLTVAWELHRVDFSACLFSAA